VLLCGVTYPLPREFREATDAIRGNRSDGAFTLAHRAAEAVKSLPANCDLMEAAHLIRQAQPSMAPLVHLAERLLRRGSPSDIAHAFLADLDQSNQVIAKHALGVFPEHAILLTHSASSTVFAAIVLAHWERRLRSVIALESQPGGEGRAFADELRSRDVAAEVVSDDELQRAIATASVVFTGADWISPAQVTNKIGTAAVCSAARERSVPAYCLASKLKKLPYDPPSDRSGFFEAVPIQWFSGLITEDGIHRAPTAGK
jgi:translation initiation factor 2B subunit (eIF-2B alpha/beta/delta family)